MVVAFAARVILDAGSALAQTPLSGVVVDDVGNAVGGATVTIRCDGDRDPRVSLTDGAGHFALIAPAQSKACDIVVSRFGFLPTAQHFQLGALSSPTLIVLRKGSSTLAIAGNVVHRSAPENMRSGWLVTSGWSSGRLADDDVRSRTLERLAGGQRWQTESRAGYITQSGFGLEAGIVGRRGYGAPLFMSRPFADDTALPELFPNPWTSGRQWAALVTVTTPATHFHGIALSGTLEGFAGIGDTQQKTPRPDRGVRANIHFKFK